MPRPLYVVRIGCRHGNILIEAGERRVELASKPQGAHQEDALGIVHVAPHLADTPFFWRIAIKRFFFRNAAQKWQRFIELALQRAENVIAGNAVDVAEIIWRSFAGLGAAGYGSDHEINVSSVGRIEHSTPGLCHLPALAP